MSYNLSPELKKDLKSFILFLNKFNNKYDNINSISFLNEKSLHFLLELRIKLSQFESYLNLFLNNTENEKIKLIELKNSKRFNEGSIPKKNQFSPILKKDLIKLNEEIVKILEYLQYQTLNRNNIKEEILLRLLEIQNFISDNNNSNLKSNIHLKQNSAISDSHLKSNIHLKQNSIKNNCPKISKGLPNTKGINCFLSSSLQMLFSCEEYRNSILNISENSVLSSNRNINKVAPLLSIKNIFKYLNSNFNGDFNYNYYFEILYKLLNLQNFQTNDPDEFLNCFFQNNKFNRDMFSFRIIKNLYKINSAGDYSKIRFIGNSNNNIDYILKVKIPNGTKNNNTDLQKLVNIYSHLEELQIPTEGNRLTHQKLSINFNENNRYLIINLSRTIFNEKTKTTIVSKKNIKINEILCIDDNSYFKIEGVICYKPGHYIYISMCNGEIYTVYNDSKVIIINDHNKNEYTELINNSAYLILYSRL